MKWEKWIQYLLPKEEERDHRFRVELDLLAVVGLRIIAGICIGAPMFMLMVWIIWVPNIQEVFRIEGAIGHFLLGVSTLAMSYWPAARPHARRLGILSGYLGLEAELLLGQYQVF